MIKSFSQLWSVINPFSGSLNCLSDSHRDQHSQKSIGLLHARTSALLSLLKCLWTLGDPVKHDAEALGDPVKCKTCRIKMTLVTHDMTNRTSSILSP